MDNASKSAKEIQKEKSLKKSRRYCKLIRHFVPIKKNKIVFSQFGGKGYGCNPKAIADEFLKRDRDYDLVWLLKKNTDISKSGLPKGVRGVVANKNSLNSLYELLTAKVWINNIHFNVLIDKGLSKRKGNIYLNTFHGGITLKNEGKDKNTYKENAKLSNKELMYRKDAEYVDYITSACDTEKHVLEEFFYNHGEIVKLGDARTDVLINGAPEVEKKVRKKYKIPDGTKIILYAPTFRSDMKLHWYDLDYNEIINSLEKEYGCPWVMIIRLHPRLASKAKKIIPKSPKFINGSNYLDMQDLLVASDMMISDYSSCVTDFMLTRKPAFLYVPDIDEYIKSRGMYFGLDELPFPYARTTDKLMEVMSSFDEPTYIEKVNSFVKRIGYLDDGQSAKRIVDFLEEKMWKK